ncbi:MAG TPA: phosphoribosylanthranilate isomerase [Clostridia bacterium]|nr:phosphoribosylanthranilate isomerase [Clostridia bacterium]
MSGVKVKICGITDPEAALAAAEAGADAVGFVFAPSSRRVTKEKAKEIIAMLPPYVDKVGVFVNAPPREVEEIAEFCRLTTIQLSGDEPPDYPVPVRYKLIRGFRVREGILLSDLARYRADAFLFDTYRPGCYGGTGEAFNWDVLRKIPSPKPVILAGGLNAGNVQQAIMTVRPYGVDVSSGVETGGRKDAAKIKEFIKLAKEVK